MELFETLKNIIIGIIIGFLYYLLIFKVTDSIFIDENPTDRIQKSVLTIYVVSILSIYASNTILSKSNEFKNNMLKYGIIIGSLSLLYNSLILNWDNLNDSNKETKRRLSLRASATPSPSTNTPTDCVTPTRCAC